MFARTPYNDHTDNDDDNKLLRSPRIVENYQQNLPIHGKKYMRNVYEEAIYAYVYIPTYLFIVKRILAYTVLLERQ